MKKHIMILIAACTMVAAHTTKAQEWPDEKKERPAQTPTEKSFSMPYDWVNIRDYIYLPGKAKLIVELNHPDQYDELMHIDTLLRSFMQEIALYRDSLQSAGGSVRIDYAVDEVAPQRKLRFKKHPADGDIFMNQDGEKARLKVDQDTVHIYVRHSPLIPGDPVKGPFNHRVEYRYSHAGFYQLTFCLNSYTDLAALIADNRFLLHAFDTLKGSIRKGTRNNAFKAPSSAIYDRWREQTSTSSDAFTRGTQARFHRFGGLLVSDSPNKLGINGRSDIFTITANVGAGVLRNTWAPYAEVGMSLITRRKNPWSGDFAHRGYSIIASSWFFFERQPSRDYRTYNNWFVNFDFEASKKESVGVGYLFSGAGQYFKGTTIRTYTNIHLLKRGLTICPELIFTDDFRQVIPAITIKAF